MSDNPETQFVPFSNRPDKKGPKTIAIVLFFGAISMILMGFPFLLKTITLEKA